MASSSHKDSHNIPHRQKPNPKAPEWGPNHGRQCAYCGREGCDGNCGQGWDPYVPYDVSGSSYQLPNYQFSSSSAERYTETSESAYSYHQKDAQPAVQVSSDTASFPGGTPEPKSGSYSQPAKDKGIPKDQSSPWSPWLWDDNVNNYYRWRPDAHGSREYRWLAPEDGQITEWSGWRVDEKHGRWYQERQTPDKNLERFYDGLDQNSSEGWSLWEFNAADESYFKWRLKSDGQIERQLLPLPSASTNYPTQPESSTSQSDLPEPQEKASLPKALNEEADQLLDHQEFKKVDDMRKFYTKGRVFQAPFTEPARPSAPVSKNITKTVFNQKAHTKICRFVVIRSRSEYCLAVQIHTFGGRGHKKHSSRSKERRRVFEAIKDKDYKSRLLKKEIPIVVENPSIGIDYPNAVIHFGKVYTIEDYVVARSIGYVPKDALTLLENCFREATDFPLLEDNAAAEG